MNGGGYYRNSPYYQDPNASFDPFVSPQQTQNNYYRNQIDPQSVDVFAEAPRRRRSSGESNSISRAIRNALDPEYYVQPSMDVLASTSYDDSSILAAVSSTHSSQEAGSSEPETSQKQKLKKPKPKSENNRFASIFNTSSSKTKSHDDNPYMPELNE